MRTRLCLAVAAALCGSAAVAEEKTPGLTKKEIADGWVMLFDGETTFGWKVDGDAAVKDGKLVFGGAKPTKAVTTAVLAPGKLLLRKSGPGGKASAGELPHPGGPVVVEVPAGDRVAYDLLAYRPTEMTSLFNGKDLTGWKVFGGDPKKVASKWEVTKDGELHVSNGPGDLQTDGKYGDFVLQLEVKTNGPALNSGVFFRCIPDQYQNGYEMQVQNAFKDGDRTKPADFGTGAIYRRIPARKVVSNDNEWFAMTLVATGPHIATWVNGYQTVDWTDDRPADENPRKGLRTAAGHLSLQGHDPTTDILFRNFRVADLSKK